MKDLGYQKALIQDWNDLNSLKEIHNIDSPDESDAIEAEKIRLEKAASKDLSFSHGELI